MKHALSTLTLAAIIACAPPAFAQGSPPKSTKDLLIFPATPSRPSVETKFEYVATPLENFLNERWEIRTTVGMGMLVLSKGEHWAVCDLNITTGMLDSSADVKTAKCKCFKLN